MESVELLKCEAEDGSIVLISKKPIAAREAAFYVAKDRSKWIVDYEKAMRIIDNGRICYKYQPMGKTGYVIIYPEDSRCVIDGMAYIIGEFMIMGYQNGLLPLDQEKMQEAFSEYVSRSVILQIAGKSITVYEIG